jgi:peptidoglycan/xylan/chitin deacetylase (PgdA/CDA1 family)
LDKGISYLTVPIPTQFFRRKCVSFVKHLLAGDNLVYHGRPGNRLALTFDDGPCPGNTEKILSILRDGGCKATFFLIGGEARKFPLLARAIHEEGHEIGNHFFSHRKLPHWDLQGTINEIIRADEVITEITGKVPFSVRPPYGRITFSLLLFTRWKRRPLVMWSRDSEDSFSLPSAEIRKNVTSPVLQGGDILLFHEDSAGSLEILPDFLREIRGGGLEVVSVGDLIGGGKENLFSVELKR